MSNEYPRSFDHGLVPSALEREEPVAHHVLGRLTAAFLASSLAVLGVPGCTIASDCASPEQGLDNGTVGRAEGLDQPTAWDTLDAA